MLRLETINVKTVNVYKLVSTFRTFQTEMDFNLTSFKIDRLIENDFQCMIFIHLYRDSDFTYICRKNPFAIQNA